MNVIRARNVNDAYALGMTLLHAEGIPKPSRYGDVWEVAEPVSTVYWKPRERVLFDAGRDANPFFHLMEALWILAGRNDVAWLAQFNKRMTEFSDNGTTFHGAYGYRLRHSRICTEVGVFDQLSAVINLLKRDPTTRRAVLSIYDAVWDLNFESKDIPCNDTIKFESRDGETLNMIVFCRSNDAIWGAYGANAVQFSFIQEYVASMAGMKVGTYTQISCNFHAYVRVFADKWKALEARILDQDFYTQEDLDLVPLVKVPEEFDADLRHFMFWTTTLQSSPPHFDNPFFTYVAVPMFRAWRLWKVHDPEYALSCAQDIESQDWQLAAIRWMNRRLGK